MYFILEMVPILLHIFAGKLFQITTPDLEKEIFCSSSLEDFINEFPLTADHVE